MNDSATMLDKWLPKFISTAKELAEGRLFGLPHTSGVAEFVTPALKSLDDSVWDIWQGNRTTSFITNDELGLDAMVQVFGSYLGEYVRKNYGGTWSYDIEDGFYLVSVCRPDISVHPFEVAQQLMDMSSKTRLQEFESSLKQHERCNPSPGLTRGWAKGRNHFKELVRHSAHSMGWQDFEWRGDIISFAGGTHNLASLAKICAESEPDTWKAHIDHMLKNMLSVHQNPGEMEQRLENLDEVKNYIRVSLRPKQYVSMDGGTLVAHVESPLEGLYAIPVIDDEDVLSSIPPKRVQAWGTSVEQLVALGLSNLLSANPPSTEETSIEGESFYLVTAPDPNYVSAFALTIDKIPGLLGSKGCLFAIPRREALIVYPCQDKDFGAALKLLTLLVPQMHDQAPKPVSPDIYYFSPQQGYHRVRLERTADSIQVHVPPVLAEMMNESVSDLGAHGNVRNQLQATALAAFSMEEQRLLEMAPLVTFFLVASADGNVDAKELRALEEALDPALFKESPVLQAAVVGLIPRFRELSMKMLSGSLSSHSYLVELRTLVEARLSPTAAMKFKLTLLDFARYIAEASGGKAFGLFGSKISKAERKVLEALTAILGV